MAFNWAKDCQEIFQEDPEVITWYKLVQEKYGIIDNDIHNFDKTGFHMDKGHLNWDFKDYCLEHKVLMLCMPAYLLQSSSCSMWFIVVESRRFLI